MSHLTCAFSTLGVQNVIWSGRWNASMFTWIKLSAWKGQGKPNSIWNSQHCTVAVKSWCNGFFIWSLYGSCVYMAISYPNGDFDQEYIVAPLSLSLMCMRSYKTSRKKVMQAFFPCVTLNGLSKRGNKLGLMVIMYFVKRKQFVGRCRLESPSLLCFRNLLRGERRLRKS